MKSKLSALMLALCLTLAPAYADHDAVAVNASVAVFNPSNSRGPCGSATICGRTPTHLVGVGAAHCFVGVIGGKFSVGAPDGKRFPATLVAHDKKTDLAIFTTEPDVTTSVAYPAVCAADDFHSAKQLSMCGYPAGKGPTFNAPILFSGIFNVERKELGDTHLMNQWHAASPLVGGSSGCGVFADGKLIGVMTRSDWNAGDGRVAYSVTNAELCQALAQCRPGDVNCWKPQPNVPVEAREPTPRDLNTAHKKAIAIQHLRNEIRELESRPPLEIIHEVPPPPAPAKKSGMSALLVFLCGIVSVGGAALYLSNAKHGN